MKQFLLKYPKIKKADKYRLNMEDIRVVIIDDHPVVLQGIQSLLSQYPDIHVVGEAGNSSAALELINEGSPDVVLLDIRLADQNGLDIARQIYRSQVKSRVIILTSHEDEEYLLEAVQANVYGYLVKGTSAEVLVEAIRAVHAGERRLSKSLISKAMDQMVELSQAQLQAKSGLSNQELKVLKLIAAGSNTQEMANNLHWSERTLKRKLKDILAKLNAANRAQAVAEAYKLGLL